MNIRQYALTISIKLIMVKYVPYKLTCFCTVLGMILLGQIFHFVSIIPSYLKQKKASMSKYVKLFATESPENAFSGI